MPLSDKAFDDVLKNLPEKDLFVDPENLLKERLGGPIKVSEKEYYNILDEGGEIRVKEYVTKIPLGYEVYDKNSFDNMMNDVRKGLEYLREVLDGLKGFRLGDQIIDVWVSRNDGPESDFAIYVKINNYPDLESSHELEMLGLIDDISPQKIQYRKPKLPQEPPPSIKKYKTNLKKKRWKEQEEARRKEREEQWDREKHERLETQESDIKKSLAQAKTASLPDEVRRINIKHWEIILFRFYQQTGQIEKIPPEWYKKYSSYVD